MAGFGRWTTEIETVLSRLLGDTPVREVVDVHGLAKAVSPVFIGLELYVGVHPEGADEALAALEERAGLVGALDQPGPLAPGVPYAPLCVASAGAAEPALGRAAAPDRNQTARCRVEHSNCPAGVRSPPAYDFGGSTMTLGSTRPVLAALSGTLLLALLGSACTSGGEGKSDKPAAKTTKPPALKQLWKADFPSGHPGTGSVGVTWHHEKTVVIKERDELLGYSADDGKRLWKVAPPPGSDGICALSTDVNDKGVGAVLFRRGNLCDLLAPLDVRVGTLQWQRPLKVDPKEQPERADHRGLSVSDKAVTLDLVCGDLRRYDIKRGKELSSPLKRDRRCAHEVEHDGSVIAALNDPVDADTPEDRGTGFIPPQDGKAAFQLYDANSGKQLWNRPVERLGSDMQKLITTRPLTLQTEERGRVNVRSYDDKGKPKAVIGKTGDLDVEAVGDGLLIGSYANKSKLHAFDLNSGKELWTRPKSEFTPQGVQRGGLLTTRLVKQGERPAPTALWVTRHDLRDPDKQRMLGAVSAKTGQVAPVGWHEDRLYVERRRAGAQGIRLEVYALPEKGENTRYQGTTVGHRSTESEQGWRKGDLRPNKVEDVCEAVSREALRGMGIRGTDLPPPANCGWSERYDPRHVKRTVQVTVTAHRADGSDSNVEKAKQEFTKVATAKNLPASLKPVPGLGKDSRARTWMNANTHSSSVNVLARHRNVTVHVSARNEAALAHHSARVSPSHQVEQGALQATADVLRKLGAKASAPEVPDQGTAGVSKVEPICAAVHGEAVGMVPGSEAEDITSEFNEEPRQSGCYWGTDRRLSEDLTVHAHALPGSAASGRGAVAEAKEKFARWRPKATAVKGLGDEAKVEHHDFEKGRSLSHCLLVRKDNLLVYLDYQRWQHPSKATMDEEIKRVARKVLSAYQ